jgi:hypothetical protein
MVHLFQSCCKYSTELLPWQHIQLSQCLQFTLRPRVTLHTRTGSVSVVGPGVKCQPFLKAVRIDVEMQDMGNTPTIFGDMMPCNLVEKYRHICTLKVEGSDFSETLATCV